MQEVDYPVLSPGVCIVCEGVPPATAFVDTLRTFDPNGYTHLNGRKYLCESCVTDAANALGLSDEAVAVVAAERDELADKVAELEADLDAFTAIKNHIESFAARPSIQVEDSVAQAVETAKSRKAQRSAAAQAAQDAIAAQEAAAAAGAARQAEIDQAAADARQAAAEAAVAPVEDPAPAEADPAPADPAPAEPAPDASTEAPAS